VGGDVVGHQLGRDVDDPIAGDPQIVHPMGTISESSLPARQNDHSWAPR
jgi:hypothetical protein